jgi:hypothetical protein
MGVPVSKQDAMVKSTKLLNNGTSRQYLAKVDSSFQTGTGCRNDRGHDV